MCHRVNKLVPAKNKMANIARKSTLSLGRGLRTTPWPKCLHENRESSRTDLHAIHDDTGNVRWHWLNSSNSLSGSNDISPITELSVEPIQLTRWNAIAIKTRGLHKLKPIKRTIACWIDNRTSQFQVDSKINASWWVEEMQTRRDRRKREVTRKNELKQLFYML